MINSKQNIYNHLLKYDTKLYLFNNLKHSAKQFFDITNVITNVELPLKEYLEAKGAQIMDKENNISRL